MSRIAITERNPLIAPNDGFAFAFELTCSDSILNPYLFARYASSRSNPPSLIFDSPMRSRAASEENALRCSRGSGRIGTRNHRSTALLAEARFPKTTSAEPDSISATASPIAFTGYGRSESTMTITLPFASDAPRRIIAP